MKARAPKAVVLVSSAGLSLLIACLPAALVVWAMGASDPPPSMGSVALWAGLMFLFAYVCIWGAMIALLMGNEQPPFVDRRRRPKVEE